MRRTNRRSWVATVLVTMAIGGAALAATPALAPEIRVGGAFVFPIATIAVVAILRRRASGGSQAEADGSAPAVTVDPASVDRRDAIRMLGLGFLGAVPVVAAPAVIDRFVAQSGTAIAGTWRTAGLNSGAMCSVNAASAGPAQTVDGRVRQWTMIVDLRNCDGCQSQGTPPQCTTACIEGEYLPQPMQWIEVYEGELPGGGTQFIPTPCQQCQNPPCVNVCPVGATFSTPEGTVLIDQERCIGCRICMAACPYDRRFFNWGDPPVPPEATLADYTPDLQAPAWRGTVMKCDFCPDMVRAGTLPFCVQGCPNDAIWYGDLEEDIATNGRELVSASRFLSQNSAYRLKEELGTDPRVYYIPGHGGLVGRDPYTSGRQRTTWPWVERAEGSKTWNR